VALEPGRYVEFYEGVVAWAREDGPPPVDPADAVAVLEILEQARRLRPAPGRPEA